MTIPLFDVPTPAADLQDFLNQLIVELNAETSAITAIWPINIKDFGAKGDNVTDDSAALAGAEAAAALLYSQGKSAAIFIPAGYYYITTPPPIMTFPISIVGEGNLKSVFRLAAAFDGDLFSWSEVWMGAVVNSWPQGGNTVSIETQTAGVKVSGISVVGQRDATGAQNAFVFYDRADQVLFNDVSVYYLKGRALYSGILLNETQSYIRESWFNGLRFYNCGDTNIPVVEFNSIGNGDASNEVDIIDVDIYANYGDGFVLNSDATVNALRSFRINNLRVEGLQAGALPGDLVRIGSSTKTGLAVLITMDNLELINPYVDQAALRVTASSSLLASYFLDINGFIGGGGPAGKGLVIERGRSSRFYFTDIDTVQTNVTLGANMGQSISILGNGLEQTWTYSIAATTDYVSGVVQKYNMPAETTEEFVSAQLPDGTTLGGNTRGDRAVDLQLLRAAASNVASAVQSAIGGGQSNTASGNWSTVPGGLQNLADGTYSVAEGLRGTARTRQLVRAFGAGAWVITGDRQIAEAVLVALASAATPVVLTADAAAAGATNVCNIPNNTSYAFRVQLIGTDITSRGKEYAWFCNGIITRDANAASTAVSLGTPEIITRGTVTGASVALTADTTNGGFAIAFDPPDANADTWHVVARIETTEVG